MPSWIDFDADNGIFTLSPLQSDVGTTSVLVTATDDQGLTGTESFSINVLSANTGFTFEVPAQSATVGSLFSIDLDDFVTLDGTVDPGVISYTLAGTPSWMTFDTTTNVLSGTPAFGDIGMSVVSATASGSNNTGEVFDQFAVVVNEMNEAPQFFAQSMRVSSLATNGTNVGVVVGSDPNLDDTLTYAITGGNDSGAFAIDSNTGMVTVADTTALTDGTTVVLTVTATDSLTPTLTGSGPVTISVEDDAATVGYTLGTFDLMGNAITTVMPGQEFELRMFATDTRSGLEADEGGVFSAFADIVYQSSLVSAMGSVARAKSASSRRTPRLKPVRLSIPV